MRNTLSAEALPAYAAVGQDPTCQFRHLSADPGVPNLLLQYGAGGKLQHRAVTTHTLDSAGYVGSGGGWRASVGDYAEFIRRIMDVLRLEYAIFGGHSVGVAKARIMAPKCPHSSAVRV